MEKMWAAAAALALLPLLCLPARGLTGQEALERQEELIDVEGLRRAAEDSGGTARYGASLDEGLEALLDTGTRELGGAVRTAARSGALLLAILMFCALAESVGDLGKGSVKTASLAGTLAVAAVAVADVNSLLGLGRGAIENMTSFANVLLPAVAALTACTGAVTGAAARQLAAALFSGLLANLISGLLVPLLYGYIAASVAQAALGREELKRMADLLKWTVTTLITIITIAFVSYLTASGVVAGTADAAAVKAAKFAISGAVPGGGGGFFPPAGTVLASAGGLRGAASFVWMSSWLLRPPLPAVGVEMSENTSWVSFSFSPSCQWRRMLATHWFTFVLASSGRAGFIMRWSRPSFRPSDVMRSILSSRASTVPECTFSARLDSSFTRAFWCSVGLQTTVWYSASGTGRPSWSAVLMSATSLKIAMSSGRLKNLAKRVRAR